MGRKLKWNSIIKTPFGDYVEDTFEFKDEKFQNYWIQNQACPDSGFYIVENSSFYDKRSIYTDLKSRNYYHYLLVGYESYIELLARNDIQIDE